VSRVLLLRALGLTAIGLVGPFAAALSAQEPCKAVLLQPESAELLQRIEGQSRDVACELLVIADKAVPQGDCAALARAQAAQGVLIVRGQPDNAASYEVVVCGGERESELRAVKAAGAGSDALSTSALYEAVALVVRSALVDFAQAHEDLLQRAADARRQAEEAARVEREAQAQTAERDAAQRARAEQEARDRAEREARAEDPPSLANPSWLILAGLDFAAIGADSASVELGLRAGVDVGALQLGLLGSYGLAAPLRDASTRLQLSRHRIALFAGLPFRVSRAFSIEALLVAGIAALERQSTSRAAVVSATDSATTASALLGAELGVALRLLGPLGLRLHAGLDLLPGAPRYVYEDIGPETTLRTERAPARPLQPRAGAMLFGTF
jgi:hypothetical protein